jgi:RND family efflux transporter MFP subunit
MSLLTDQGRGGGLVRIFGPALVALAIAIVALITWHLQPNPDLPQSTERPAVPRVQVIHPAVVDIPVELVLPGDIEAYFEAPIYSRVAGYVKQWYEDIGAAVKAGQVLAEIDAPDLDQRLEHARADLATAQANAELARITARRWESLLKRDAVARQEADEKTGDWQAKKALAAAAEAEVGRLEVEESFKRIIAPFDGVVSARNTDIGALVNVGSSSGRPLFVVVDIHRMRIYTRVPQYDAADLVPGMPAILHIPQYPDEAFPATLATTSNRIAKESRTLLVELHADNKDGKLLPGAYADVHLTLSRTQPVLRIPTSAVIFRQHGLQVAVVGGDGKVALKPIRVAREARMEMEVVAGLSPSDRVIREPPDSLANGDFVEVVDGGRAHRRAPLSRPPGEGDEQH